MQLPSIDLCSFSDVFNRYRQGWSCRACTCVIQPWPDTSPPLFDPSFVVLCCMYVSVTCSGAGSSAVEALMVEAGKALDSSADVSSTPTGVDEEEKRGDGVPATPTTVTGTVAAATTTTTSPSATPAAPIASVDTALDSGSKTGNVAVSSDRNAKLRESLRSELELYASGSQVDASPCYVAFEAIFSKPGLRVHKFMCMLMNCIEGETRRPRYLNCTRSTPGRGCFWCACSRQAAQTFRVELVSAGLVIAHLLWSRWRCRARG